MTTHRVFAYVLLGAASLSGCAVSMHTMHPVRVSIAEMPSAVPASNVPFTVTYDYDSYGWFYFANAPREATAVTDSQGTAVVNLADFRCRILLKVDGKLTALNQQLVREGGVVSVSRYKVTLTPVR